MWLGFRGDRLAWSLPEYVEVALSGRILLHGNPDDDHYRDPSFELLTDAESARASGIAIRADVQFVLEEQWMRWWSGLAPDGTKPNSVLHQRLMDRYTRAALHYVTPSGGVRRQGPDWVRVLVRMEEPKHTMVRSWLRDAARRGHAPSPHLSFRLVSRCDSKPSELPTWDAFLAGGYAGAPMLCESAEMWLSSTPAMPEPSTFFYEPVKKL